MKLAMLGVAAATIGCGGAAYKSSGRAPGATAVAADGGARSAAPIAAGAAGNGATIATGESVRPAPGQLTAGVWDDNLNYNFFASYAQVMRTSSQDLAAFTAEDQRASRDAFSQQTAKTELDVQIVLDTTGSMGDEIAYLQSEFDSISEQVRARFPNMTPRWSLVLYKDRGDEYITRPFDFTTDPKRFQRDLAAAAAGGGGDFPEAVIAALEVSLAQRWRTESSVAKLVFWVADAPPHHGEGSKLAALARRFRNSGIHIYPVASSGIDDATEYQMRATAQLTGGRYIFLTDDSGVGNSHAEPHIPCYSVTRLDHAVVRMIESELTAQRITTKPEHIVRRVGNPDAEGACKVRDEQVVAF